MRQNLLFLHIPKTAGSSVRRYLENHFGEQDIFRINGPDYEGELVRLQGRIGSPGGEPRLVVGHFPFGLHAMFSGPCRYFTVLRDPVDRVVSLYYFIKSTRSHPRFAELNRKAMTLEDFALSGMHPEIENCQTKMLAGRLETRWYDGVSTCGEQDFELARSRLVDGNLVLGLFERLDDATALLEDAMQWPPGGLERTNVTRARRRTGELTARERRAIESVNEFDRRLYADACKVHTERRGAMPLRAVARRVLRRIVNHAR